MRATPTAPSARRYFAEKVIVDAVRKLGTATVTEVAERAGYAREYVWEVLKRLESAGTLRRFELWRPGPFRGTFVVAYRVASEEAEAAE